MRVHIRRCWQVCHVLGTLFLTFFWKTIHFLCLLLDASLNISILLTLLAHRARSRLFYSITRYTNYLLTYLLPYFTLKPNMKWIGWPVAEIWPFEIVQDVRSVVGRSRIPPAGTYKYTELMSLKYAIVNLCSESKMRHASINISVQW